jgi:acetate kinase
MGISGIGNDMRELQASSDKRARIAIDAFCYRARKYVGSYLAAMGGADAIIFTGGIGEHAPAIRAQICEGLTWAGLKVDEAANNANATRISTEDSRLQALRIPTDEELLIARDTVRSILGIPHPS